MVGEDSVIDGLQACLKYERTLEDCAEQYHQYFKRWRIFGIMKDFGKLAKRARQSKKALMARLNDLDTIPSQDRYPIEVEPIDKASSITRYMDYFYDMAVEALGAYESAQGECARTGDSVTSGILGELKCKQDALLRQFEAKLKKVALVGPELYITEHMH
jgi:bacterioferritin (cytochrome b1)